VETCASEERGTTDGCVEVPRGGYPGKVAFFARGLKKRGETLTGKRTTAHGATDSTFSEKNRSSEKQAGAGTTTDRGGFLARGDKRPLVSEIKRKNYEVGRPGGTKREQMPKGNIGFSTEQGPHGGKEQ